MSHIHSLTAEQLLSAYGRREVSPLEVAHAYLTRAHELNETLGAFTTITPDLALAQAQEAERRIRRGDALRGLEGIPIAIKDLSDHVAGVPNSYGTLTLSEYIPAHDSLHVRRLRDAGAVFVGKTNTPEFGHKGVTDNLLVGPTRNPFDLSRNAGGSSGGSAAAVAAGLAVVAQGSDGGGSIRIPAANCGICGYKPSFGRVPLDERPNAFVTHAPFDHVGPLARTVGDAQLMTGILAGQSGRDPFSLPTHGEFRGALDPALSGLRIAYSPDLGVFPVANVVKECVAQAVKGLLDAGATVEEVEFILPRSQEELSDVWLRQAGVGGALAIEVFRKLGIDLLEDRPEDLPPEYRRMVEVGRQLSAVEHRTDDIARTEVLDAVEGLLADYDCLVCPTLTVPPVVNGVDGRTVGPSEVNGRTVDPCIGWCMTYPFNFTGHPAASLPGPMTPDGLPVGMQVVGRRHCDATVLSVAAGYERARPWARELAQAQALTEHRRVSKS